MKNAKSYNGVWAVILFGKKYKVISKRYKVTKEEVKSKESRVKSKK